MKLPQIFNFDLLVRRQMIGSRSVSELWQKFNIKYTLINSIKSGVLKQKPNQLILKPNQLS